MAKTILPPSDLFRIHAEATEILQQGILWLNEEGTILHVNTQFALDLGYTSDSFTPTTIFQLNPYNTYMDWRKQWKELLEYKQITLDAKYLAADGSIRPVKVQGVLLEWNGQKVCFSMVEQEQVQVSSQLPLYENAHLLHESSELVCWLREDGSLVAINDKMCNESGYSREELKQIRILDIYKKHFTAEKYAKEWQQLLKNGLLKGETLLLRKDGSELPVLYHVTVTPFLKEICAFFVMTDISENKRQEAALQKAFEEIKQLKEKAELENLGLKNNIALEYTFGDIISASKSYKKVLKKIEQVADTEATVLITGETGTGKELLARAIHQFSKRKHRSMVKINCGALPENLIESELFGHEKGAFTGAYQQKLGRFELAHQGTLFLDEVGELPLNLQTKLLRVLQEGEFERVGGTKTIKVDVRVITATNRNLEQMMENKKFRQDLYYRLHVFPIYNIPLRERREDIPILVAHFIKKFAQKIGRNITEVSQESLEMLTKYDFPGNVRELENIIERAVILSDSPVLTFDPFALKSAKQTTTAATFKTLDEIQRDHILEALHRTGGQVSGTKKALLTYWVSTIKPSSPECKSSILMKK